jgi:hypothetical protein
MIPNKIRRGQRRAGPGEVLVWRPAADALARIRAEQAQAAAELARGAPDVRGLRQCITDWVMEEILCDETTAMITARRQTPVTPS